MFKNFEQYEQKLKKIEGVVEETFEKVAKKSGIKFVKEAKDLTEKETLVDTGNYRRNWTSDIGVVGETSKAFAVKCINPVEYASFLENGYVVKKDYFVPFSKLEGTPKVKAFIAKIKAKNPKAKGFIRKAGRYKGHFIGKQALETAREYAHSQLKKELGDLYESK